MVLENYKVCSPLAWMLAVSEAITVYWEAQPVRNKLVRSHRSHLQGCILSVVHVCLSGSRPTIKRDRA